MENIKQMIDELQATTGKKQKKEIIKKYKENEDCMSVLYFLLNDYIKTGMAQKSLTKDVFGKTVHSIRAYNDLQQFMKSIEGGTGSDQLLRRVHSFAADYEDGQYKDIIYGIASKSIKLGVSADSVNEAMGYSFIPTFGIQRAHEWSKHHEKIKGNFMIQQKYDGFRMTAFTHKDKDLTCHSRSGQEIEGLTELAIQIDQLPKGFVFDGELLAVNDGSMTALEQFALTSKIARKKGEKKNLMFKIFDIIPINKYNEGSWDCPYENRYKVLSTAIKDKIIFNKLTLLEISEPQYIGSDKNKVQELELASYERNEEGIMVWDLEAGWANKKGYNVLKVKETKTADILCTGWEYGEKGTKYEHLLGSITCDWKGHRLDISGMSDAEREAWTANPDLIVNKIVEIKFNGESRNQNGGISVRFPRFSRIRFDKGINDIDYGE